MTDRSEGTSKSILAAFVSTAYYYCQLPLLFLTFACTLTTNPMATIKLTINNQPRTLDVEPDMPLLWAIRDVVGLTGTKFGCGIAQCGACTVHLDGSPVRSCSVPVSAVAGQKITTIEGISKNADHPVQKAWIAHQVPQCGYCQSGQIMSAVALLKTTPKPTDSDIDNAMQGNICRCGTYTRVREAIHTASAAMGTTNKLPNTGAKVGKR